MIETHRKLLVSPMTAGFPHKSPPFHIFSDFTSNFQSFNLVASTDKLLGESLGLKLCSAVSTNDASSSSCTDDETNKGPRWQQRSASVRWRFLQRLEIQRWRQGHPTFPDSNEDVMLPTAGDPFQFFLKGGEVEDEVWRCFDFIETSSICYHSSIASALESQ